MINDLLRDKLKILASDELLIEAIREVFNKRIEKEKPLIGEADNNLLGEKYRAYEETKQIIEKGFTDLKSYEATEKQTKGFNKER